MPLQQAQEIHPSTDATALLDDLIPLHDASHADVVEYLVEIPLRYAQCYARLNDGRKVPLSKAKRFIGWSAHEENKALLFRCKGSTLELGLTDTGSTMPGRIRNIIYQVMTPQRAAKMKKFVGIDGGLVYQPAS